MHTMTTPTTTIVSQNDTNVNSESYKIAIKSLEIAEKSLEIVEKTLEKVEKSSEIPTINTEKWVEKQPMKDKIAKKLYKCGLKERADRMNNCANVLEYVYCKNCGKVHIKRANLCRDRFCPICSWRLSLQRVGEMQRLVDTLQNGYPELTYSLVTLTVKNCEVSDFSDTLQKMSKAWNLAISQRGLRPRIFGWARSTELTYNKATHQLHPHYHIITAWHSDQDRQSCEDAIKDAWISASQRDGLIADIKAQDARSIASGHETEVEKVLKATVEVFKYAVKTNDMDTMPVKEFKVLAEQFASKRTCDFGGKFRELKKALKMEMDKVEDDDIQIGICRDCGAIGVSDILLKWSFGERAYKLFR